MTATLHGLVATKRGEHWAVALQQIGGEADLHTEEQQGHDWQGQSHACWNACLPATEGRRAIPSPLQ